MYALASVLQQRGAAAQPADQALRLSLLGPPAAQPGAGCSAWAAMSSATSCSSSPSGTAPLVVVQPLLVCGLLFALPLGAAWAGRKLRERDWIAAVLVCAGLAVFLIVAVPHPGTTTSRPIVWIAAPRQRRRAPSWVSSLLSSGRAAWQRAVLLSAAAGVVYGVTAALTKTSSHLLDGGILLLLAHWQPYALLVAGIGGMVIAQSAFQAGSLDASLPTMSVVDPIVSIVIGAVAFGESIAAGPGDVLLEVIALVAMSAGVFLLARSEAVRSLHGTAPSSAK